MIKVELNIRCKYCHSSLAASTEIKGDSSGAVIEAFVEPCSVCQTDILENAIKLVEEKHQEKDKPSKE